MGRGNWCRHSGVWVHKQGNDDMFGALLLPEDASLPYHIGRLWKFKMSEVDERVCQSGHKTDADN